MQYDWKPLPEVVRAVALAAVVFVAVTLTQLGGVTDWSTFAASALTGLASAVGTALLGALTPSS